MQEPLPADKLLPPPKPRWRRPSFWLLLLVIIIALLLIWHVIKSINNNKPKKKPPTPVVQAIARTENVPVLLSGLGSVTPTYSITVRTQINGLLMRVYFREGQMVKAGDLLAEIDVRPFLAQLKEFEGNLQRDQAQLENARIDLRRYERLYPQGAVSQQTYATQLALVNQLEGTVKSDIGQIEAVKINIVYCGITSPIDGRVGLRLVDPGNFVQTSDTNGIVIVNMIRPITVIFTLPEDNIPQVQQAIKTGKPLMAYAFDRAQKNLLATGTLITIDNQIDPTTGTVKLRAQFANEENNLFPDQFVNVNLLVDVLKNATIIPTAAIQRGPQGNFVYIVNQNKKVSMKYISTNINYGLYTVVTSGVKPGDAVVIEGADRLVDGSTVTPTTHMIATPKQTFSLNKQNIPLPNYFKKLTALPLPAGYENWLAEDKS